MKRNYCSQTQRSKLYLKKRPRESVIITHRIIASIVNDIILTKLRDESIISNFSYNINVFNIIFYLNEYFDENDDIGELEKTLITQHLLEYYGYSTKVVQKSVSIGKMKRSTYVLLISYDSEEIILCDFSINMKLNGTKFPLVSSINEEQEYNLINDLPYILNFDKFPLKMVDNSKVIYN